MEKNIINLIFDSGKGTCAVRSREGVTGEPYGELPIAARPGYRFEGWFTQPEVNGDKVTSGDTVESENDVTLYAVYTRLAGKQKKKSSMRLQKRVLVALLCTILVFIVGLLVTNYVVSIVRYTDYDGNVYKAKKADGAYSVYDAAGEELEVNEDGYYITALGTQLSLDKSTGEIAVYAVVDTEGIEVEGANSRIMMFAQIRQANVQRIEVQNAYGSYTFYTDTDGTVKILGFEDKLVSYNKELYPYLCVGCGYPLTLQKLDTAEVLKRGYEEYGLVACTRVDADGNEYEYKPVHYTILSKDGVKHSVYVGDATVSGAGYYVKLEGDDHPAVYIMNGENYEKALLQPIENLVNPLIVYPTSLTTYFNVEDFIVASCPEGDVERLSIDVAFDYIDMTSRENTLYSTEPYAASDGYRYQYGGYRLSADACNVVLQAFYTPNIERICKLGFTDDDLVQYGLDKPEHYITYTQLVDEDSDGVTDYKVNNVLFISGRTEKGTYYVASALCDCIAEVNESSFYFLEYEPIDWVYKTVIWMNLAYVKTVDVQSPAYSVNFTIDNSESDQSQNVSSANAKVFVNGAEPDYTVYKTSAATGKRTEQAPIYNFRQFYKSLLSCTISGSTGDGHIKLTEEEMAAYRAMDDSECQLVLTIDCEDIASVVNPTYNKENNKLTLVYRFYRYSEGRSYLTINGEGEFFVDASFVEKLISDAQKMEKGVLIDSESKT